jgi:hypothetical protein
MTRGAVTEGVLVNDNSFFKKGFTILHSKLILNQTFFPRHSLVVIVIIILKIYTVQYMYSFVMNLYSQEM